MLQTDELSQFYEYSYISHVHVCLRRQNNVYSEVLLLISLADTLTSTCIYEHTCTYARALVEVITESFRHFRSQAFQGMQMT